MVRGQVEAIETCPKRARLRAAAGARTGRSKRARGALLAVQARGRVAAVQLPAEPPLSVPLAARKTAEGDQADHDDDQPDPKAPDDHQHDPDDDNDSARRYPGDSASILPLSHALLL